MISQTPHQTLNLLNNYNSQNIIIIGHIKG